MVLKCVHNNPVVGKRPSRYKCILDPYITNIALVIFRLPVSVDRIPLIILALSNPLPKGRPQVRKHMKEILPVKVETSLITLFYSKCVIFYGNTFSHAYLWYGDIACVTYLSTVIGIFDIALMLPFDNFILFNRLKCFLIEWSQIKIHWILFDPSYYDSKERFV